MKILIVTQKVDRKDPILGFFHRWIEELATHCEKITVIGQYVGDHDLPSNVNVVSLGKEKGISRMRQMFNFQCSIFNMRHTYDVVFVHMTPIWIVCGSLIWIFFRKRTYLWYEARGKGWNLRVALLFVRKVFSASASGMPIATLKSVITGHGIDTDMFIIDPRVRPRACLISVGRITRSKRIEVLLHILEHVAEEYVLMLIGEARTREDKAYQLFIESEIHAKRLGPRIAIRAHAQDKVVAFLQSALVFVHASETALDKAVLEAMACGCPVVSTNPAVKEILPSICHAEDATMAEKIEYISQLSDDERRRLCEDLRERVLARHSLTGLIQRLILEMR